MVHSSHEVLSDIRDDSRMSAVTLHSYRMKPLWVAPVIWSWGGAMWWPRGARAQGRGKS